jgi:tetratricopeptide (TPR) repeat protein
MTLTPPRTLTVAGTRAELAAARRALPGSVGVVMTMGALHDGHAALIRRAHELAAATWAMLALGYLTPAAILARLDHRLALLSSGGPRDALPRQRTLRATIAWSYDLLDENERRLLERLAVFAGGCALDAAEVVCADDDVGDVLEGISSLVEKSLLRAQGVVGGQPRFSMLQTLREFSLERLEQRGEAERVRRRHADFFVDLAEEAGPALLGREQDVWMERVGADFENLRTAMRWSLDTGEPGRVARVGGGLWPFCWEQGRMLEGVTWMEEALRAEDDLSADERATATFVLGILAFGWGDYERAAPALARAQELCRASGNWFGESVSLALAGVMAAVRGDPVAGEEMHHQALKTFCRTGDRWGMGFIRYSLGRVLLLQGRNDDARAMLEQSVADVREVGEKQLLVLALLNLAWARLGAGDLSGAKGALVESLDLAIGIRYNRIDTARVLEALAAVAVAVGDPLRGSLLFGAADGVRRSAGADVWVPDRPFHDRTEQALRAALDSEEYIARLEKGAALSLDDLAGVAAAL